MYSIQKKQEETATSELFKNVSCVEPAWVRGADTSIYFPCREGVENDAHTDLVFPQAVIENNTVIEEGERHGVRTYIFAPCIVYGRGEGFGNPISIQTVAIVKAARAMKRVYKVEEGRPSWPVCHVLDNTSLYFDMLRHILDGKDLGHGRNGYFLASPGSVAWDDLYKAMAAALAKRNVIADDSVVPANQGILEQMAEALECTPDFVPVQLGGS